MIKGFLIPQWLLPTGAAQMEGVRTGSHTLPVGGGELVWLP